MAYTTWCDPVQKRRNHISSQVQSGREVPSFGLSEVSWYSPISSLAAHAQLYIFERELSVIVPGVVEFP